MRLLRLQLQGFKSFADKTEIVLADGITVVVGPNGCGKSNISDAVRWVLGEQNIRNLRGQKAEDIIFSGSETRKAKNAAEVTLVLDNSAHELPLDTAEVSVSRRLLRNGDSEFYLNRRACRLKDIQELFANTGLGRDSLAIIGQNRVDRVLSARPEERRMIFEEVAGISKYRMRKIEGLRKLETTDQNMDRVRDLTALLDEQLGPLAEAAEKTKACRVLQEEKRAAEAAMSLLRLGSDRRMLSRYENEYRTLTDQDASQRAEASGCDAAQAAFEEEASRRQDALRQAGDEAARQQKELERFRGDFRVKEEALRHGEEDLQRLAEERVRQADSVTALKEGMHKAAEEARQAAVELTRLQEELVAAKAVQKEKQDALREAEANHQALREQQQRQEAERELAQAEKARSWEDIQRFQEEEQRLGALLAELEKSHTAVQTDLQNMEARETTLTRRLAELEVLGKEKGQLLQRAETVLNEAEKRQSELTSQLGQTRSRRDYLEKLDREHASFSNTVKTILQSRESWRSHVLGAVGELIQVPSPYAAAAEVALGGTLSYIVTDTADSAGTIIRWLKERRLGRTTFYPLDSIQVRRSDEAEQRAAREKGMLGIAAELFSCDNRYRKLLDFLLGRVLIAEDLDTARAVAKRYGHRLRIVTLDGQVVHPGGSMTGGSMRRQENTFFGRKKEIEELSEKSAEEERKISQLEEERQQILSQCGALRQAMEEARDAWQKLKWEEAALAGQKEGLEGTLRAQKAEKDKNAEEQARLRQHVKDTEERLAAAEERIQSLPEPGAPIPVFSAEIEKEACAAAEKRVLSLHVAVTRAEEQAVYLSRQETERAEQIRRVEAAGQATEEQADRRQEEVVRLKREMETISARFEAARILCEEGEKKRRTLEEEAENFALRRRENEKKWRALQEASLSLQKQLADRESRIESLNLRIQEEKEKLAAQGLTEETAEALRLKGTMPEMERRLQELDQKLSALGPVNPNGEAEYEEQKKRRAFYEAQIEDLQKARQGLETVIREIDETMARQFTDAFEQINQEFQRIVQIMFQGGSARLELTDADHPLDGGVELFLHLPGKKRQPLSLMSGGERALTVIALLISFLAYRPAPFCFVDEIDAALDDANVERFSRMIREYKKKSQFIVISHRKKTMEFADTLQGVTMGEKGVSSLVTVRVGDYIKEA